jgi:aldehyde dehydrogenase (NAD+)
MENTLRPEIEKIFTKQKGFFAGRHTRELKFRQHNLQKFRDAIIRYEKKITDALWTDLHKTYEEAYLTEISIVLQEINNHLKHMKAWARPWKVSTPIHLLPSRYTIIHEPLGVGLIMAPWNYPFQLLMNPLVGAISSGCCSMLKPSPYTPNTARVMEEMIGETFDEAYISIVQGNREVNQTLLELRFDVIFFTGSPALGKTVMKAASQYLTPVVLELGGKSPCIVDADANIALAAKRIVWGKLINAGQTCIAPDYLLVHQSVKEALIAKIIVWIEIFYGKDARQSRVYPRIVNLQAMERLQQLMVQGTIRYGGEVDLAERYIAPTIIDDIRPDFRIMQEEIFGPVLPVMSFSAMNEVISYINDHEKPLAFYYFGSPKRGNEVFAQTSSGGGCINDTLIHIANHKVPFGGVGNSGMNKYHGHDSFLAFSNRRSVAKTPTWIDIPFRYPPFKNFRLVKKLV